MGVLSDREIEDRGIVKPCFKQTGFDNVSYGLSSYGYDARLSDRVVGFNPLSSSEIDCKNFAEGLCQELTIHREPSPLNGLHDFVYLPPHSFALGESMEFFRIPRDVIAICVGKSTYARCGIIVNVTPLEPEWEGTVTIEISNTTPLPARLYVNEGIMQVLFLRASEVCEVGYGDRKGKYIGQRGITYPLVKGQGDG